MKKILFSKYNSLRKPQFQTETRIIEEDGALYVDKRPIRPTAQPHIDRISDNYEKVIRLYGENLKVVSSRRTADGVAFPYIKGKSLLERINFERDPVPEIVEALKPQLQVITSVSREKIHEFVLSDGFSEMFPECRPGQCPAFTTANMDSVFSNFIDDGTDIWCIDYEWVFDFDIPVDYIRYRSVLYVYKENETYLAQRISQNEFLVKCGIAEEQLPLYERMEACFQQYVHGKDVRYIYTEKYKKTVETESQLRQTICDKENHIRNLTAQIEGMNQHIHDQDVYIAKVRRAMKDPMFAASLAGKKLARKVRGTSEKKSGE
jgi:hypothetical protein